MGMDLNQAVNVFTKSLMWKITEGHPVENEEIEALNAMRENAGMKPLNISIPSGAKSEPAQERQYPPNSQRKAPDQPPSGKAKAPRKPSHEEQNYESYAPQPITVNGKQFEGQLLPDNSQWTNRFYIKSESSGRLYTVAQNKNRRYWACSCPGWIGHRKCKHLTSMGLPTHEQPFEAQLKAASVKTAAIKIADETWSPLAHVLAAEIIHSDDELSSMMESALPEVEGEVHIEGPEAGPSNDELHANSSPLNGPEGSPAFDGDLKHPERQNTNAIREALETQVEMEVGKPIDQKQEEVAMQEKVQDAALAQGAGSLAGGAAATEVTAKPGTQIIINVASWDYPAKKAALLNKTASYSREELKQAGKDFLKKLRTAAISVAQGEDTQGFHMLVDMNGREYVLRGPDAEEFRREYAAIQKPEVRVNALVEKYMGKLQPYGQQPAAPSVPKQKAKQPSGWGIPNWLKNKEKEEEMIHASKSAAFSADWCDNCINRLHPDILASTAPGYETTGNCEKCGAENTFVRPVKVPVPFSASKKVAYVKHCPGHKNSKGESAEWCIYSHETGKIISSEKSEGAAKKQLQNMHAHSGSAKQAADHVHTPHDPDTMMTVCEYCGIDMEYDEVADVWSCGDGEAVSDDELLGDDDFTKDIKESATVESDGIGGENQPGATAGHAGGMFGGTDLEGPSFKDKFAVEFTFRGTSRQASFSSIKEAHAFIKSASAKFGKVAGEFVMKCPSCQGSAKKNSHGEDYKCPCGWTSSQTAGQKKQASVKKANEVEMLEQSDNPVASIIETVFAQLLANHVVMYDTPPDIMARAVSRLKTKIKKTRRGDTITYEVNVPELKKTFKIENPSSLQYIDDFKQNPYKDPATGLPKKGAADPAKRNLVLEILKAGPKTTGEIEKALGGGKYTNISWPILNELLKEGMLSHKKMRWSLKAASKTATFGKKALSLETRVNETNTTDVLKVVTDKLNEIFATLKRIDPQGYMDSFEAQLPSRMMDIAQEMGLQMDHQPESDTYLFYDQTASGTKGKSYEELTAEPKQESVGAESGMSMASLKSASIRITSIQAMPRSGTPEAAELKIAIQTLKMPEAIANFMGGPGVDHAHKVLARYGLKWDEEAYMAGGKGVKKAGDGRAKTEEQVEKEAGFNFFFPGQVLEEFYPELQHEIVDYPNATNQPMSGAGTPEIVGDGGHELEGLLDSALDTNIVEMIQLPADVGEMEPLAMAASKSATRWKMDTCALCHKKDDKCTCEKDEKEKAKKKGADYSSTSPAGGMGIGRDGKPEVLEGAPLRKENDIRGYMFTDEFYGQYEGIPGAAMNVASKIAAEGDEAKQFGMFLKKVCGEIAATLVAAFKVTTRPLLDKVPGMGELQLDTIEQGQNVTMTLGQITQGGRVKYLMDKLNDGDVKAAINDAWAQAAVWNDNADGGFVYEVFVRPETIDTDSLVMKYKFVCGTRE